MNKTKLARAVALAISSVALSVGAVSTASAHVSYNTFNAYASNIGTDDGTGTDGWSTAGSWVGTAGWCPTCGTGSTPGGGATPFGSSSPVANWAAQLHAAGGSLVVSSQNAHDDYGIWADIDTAKGAWNDKGPTGPASPDLASEGWGHNTDVGLFKSDVTQQVTLKISSLLAGSGGWNNFGISVFSGMPDAGYDHHGQWNANYRPTSNYSPNTAPAMANNPLGTAGLTYLTYTDNSSVTFTAVANQEYTFLLGGFAGADNYGPHAGYELNISSAPVPVPAAAWLFGGALVSLFGANRRKKVLPA